MYNASAKDANIKNAKKVMNKMRLDVTVDAAFAIFSTSVTRIKLLRVSA